MQRVERLFWNVVLAVGLTLIVILTIVAVRGDVIVDTIATASNSSIAVCHADVCRAVASPTTQAATVSDNTHVVVLNGCGDDLEPVYHADESGTILVSCAKPARFTPGMIPMLPPAAVR